jgi:hypothetical protein
LSDGFKIRIVEKICKGKQAIEIIWSALPGLALSAEPSTIRTNVGPNFAKVAA